MSRAVVGLVLDTGLPESYWLEDSDPRVLDTALAIREAAAKEMERARKRKR